MGQAFKTKRIKYQNLQKILKTSVESARKALECDRVIIYDASNLSQARILAESVAQKDLTLLGKTVKDPFFNNIKTEIATKTATLESETQALVGGVDDFQTANQKLDQIASLNQEISNLIRNTSDSLETQIQGSTFAKDSVQELASITERISQQSIAMIQSFRQLGRIIS